MPTEVKEIGPCKLSIKIEIPQDKVKEKLDAKYKEFITETVVPGFRKGHAPRTLVERKFGKGIKEEVKLDLISSAFDETIKEKKISPLTDPAIDPAKIAFDEAQALSFEVTLEVKPEIKIEKYTGIKVTRPKPEVTEADLTKTLDDLRQRRAELIPMDKKYRVKKGDSVILDQEIYAGEESLHKQENIPSTVGSEVRVFNQPSPELTDALVNMKIGQSKEISLKIPDDYHKKELQGQEATLKFTVKEVKQVKLPALTDPWAKEMNFDSLTHLKEEVKKGLMKGKQQAAEEKMEEEIIDNILKETDFSLPESLIVSSTEQFQKRHKTMLIIQGKSMDEIAKEVEKNKDTSREAVVKDLKTYFILEEIAKQEKIYVVEDEVTGRINEIAARQNQLPQQVKDYHEKHNLMGQLRSELKHEKVRKFLREKAEFTD